MNKADRVKLIYFFSISLLIFLYGCIDTNVQVIPSSFDFRSQLKVVNLTSLGGAATVKVLDNTKKVVVTVSALNVGDEYPGSGTAFIDIPAGTHTFISSFANISKTIDTVVQSLDSDKKVRLFLIEKADSTRKLISCFQRYTTQTKGSAYGKGLYPADSACVLFFNGASDISIAAIEVKGTTGSATVFDSTITISKELSTGQASAYYKLKIASNYAITFKDPDGNSSAVATFTPQSQGRYSAVVYGSKSATYKSKVYTDD
jgi:hypothetical protein